MTDDFNRDRFWLVWCPRGNTPTVCHYTRNSADAEAERLAEANPGKEFFVMKAVFGAVALPPPSKRLTLVKSTEQVPF